MDINLIRSFGTLFIFIAFIWLCFWAYNPKRKQDFDEAEMLPFNKKTRDEIKRKNILLNNKKGANKHV